jgi:type I pantothenate kinase
MDSVGANTFPEHIVEPLHHIASLLAADARIVAVGGAVGVGKTTFAQQLAAELEAIDRGPVEVVSTDGFLLTNDVLDARGLTDRKGFPESYDLEALRSFAHNIRSGTPSLRVPEYSHDVFDVVPGRTIGSVCIVILEGVNALQPEVAALADTTIYLDAPDGAILRWYTRRFVEFTELARATGEGFYTRFAHLPNDGVAVVAHTVWDSINRPNLEQHILPSRTNAHVVVTKNADHDIVEVEVTTERPEPASPEPAS